MRANSGFVPVLHAAAGDRPDEADTLATADCVAGALRRLGYQTEIIALGLDLSVLEALAGRRPAAVFNLVEAMHGDDQLIAIVPMLLEHFRMSFTGGDAAAISGTMSKVRCKTLLLAAGLPVADWSMDGSGCDKSARYIVKADTQHGSLGMDQASVVAGGECAREIAKRSEQHKTRFFAERYIEGREFNVALIASAAGDGLRLLPIQEIVFEDFAPGQPRIVDYAAKWDPDATVYHTTPRRFGIERAEPVLAEQLARISREAWRALGLSGYARVDFRTDTDGRPFVLEVNVNPAVAPDAGFAAAAQEAGFAYDELIEMIVTGAIAPIGAGAASELKRHA